MASIAARLDALAGPAVVRIGVTGLARAGKTALLASIAANLLALGNRVPALPALTAALGNRRVRVAVANAGAAGLPRFDYASHIAALAADPPRWPARTDAISVLALDLRIDRAGALARLPPRRIRLELLDYPGEWLLDLPLLHQDFAAWSNAVLAGLRRTDLAGITAPFLTFAGALPAQAAADETLAQAGHALYRTMLGRLRDETGLSMLQPGRFLMPAPGPEPPWLMFFPLAAGARGGLSRLLASRYDAYRNTVREDLLAPGFGGLDRLVVLVDVLAALQAGPAAFLDTETALAEVAAAVAMRRQWTRNLPAWLARLAGGVRKVAFVASKADHVAERQRGNLARLVGEIAAVPRTPSGAHPDSMALAVAAIRCTEDFVWQLDGHPVSAVRGRVLGEQRFTRSYPGEVPDRRPDAAFWAHRFLAPPRFEPMRLADAGRGGAPQIGLDQLLAFLLGDVL